MSQSRRWRHPSNEFAKRLVGTLVKLQMLTSSVFLETSIPNIPSITVLSLHRLVSTSPASSNLVHRIHAHARPRIPSNLNSGAWETGPNLPHGLFRQGTPEAHRSPRCSAKCVHSLNSLQRTRDEDCSSPPAQIRTCSFPAYGFHLGSKRAIAEAMVRMRASDGS